jgi:molybdopterin-binding protein
MVYQRLENAGRAIELDTSPSRRKHPFALNQACPGKSRWISIGFCNMKLSARNQLPGTIKSVKTGATTTHVTIEVSPTVLITASITNEAAEDLKLAPGMAAFAVIKASDVMVGV